MITLNSEQGLVIVNSWEDIVSRPGFEPNLNPSDHKLDSIVGRYIFKERIRCGLSNCHTLHAKGYIVTTKEGLSTNIGKDCGKNYFGVDFETLSKKFDRDITEKENRRRLESFSFQIEDIETMLSDLRRRPRGADWIYKKTRALVSANQGCPEVIVRKISAMIKSGTDILTIDREATTSEIDDLEAMHSRQYPRPHFIPESVANIAGLQALYQENDLKNLLVHDLDTNLREFKEKDINSLTYEELRRWIKWADSVENTLEIATKAVALGGNLLTKSNLEPFNRLFAKSEDYTLFHTYINGLQTA